MALYDRRDETRRSLTYENQVLYFNEIITTHGLPIGNFGQRCYIICNDRKFGANLRVNCSVALEGKRKMTPLDQSPKGPERGKAGRECADQLHVRADSHANGDPSSPGDTSHAVPLKKKRARRRQRGKIAVHTDTQNGVAEQKKRRRRKRAKRPLTSPALDAERPKAGAVSQPHEKPHHHGSIQYAMQRKMPLYAALDLGTNNCRLLIATPTKPGHFRVVDAFSRIVRLGEGLGHSGRLNDKAMDRAIEALKICRSKLDQKHIRRHRLIATEACRSAENGVTFIQRVLDETGLDLEIVDRETEARLAVSGCGTLVEHDTDAIVLFDIGGGSSEIALIDISQKRSPRLAEHITAWTSLPVGVVTLAERFGGEDVTAEDFEKMKDHVRNLLQSFSGRDKLGALAKSPRFHLLGTSGTVTTLAGIHLDLERYDRRRIDGVWMDSTDVTRMTERLLSWNLAQRIANPCIGQDRADLVLAGCAILEAIREIWPSERLRVADRGLREGILTELMSRDGAWRRRKRPAIQHPRTANRNESEFL